MGSTTKIFRIYNKHSQPLNISKIYLATGAVSPYKLNVDGVPGKSFTDIEIAGGDSLFVFVQVTVDPTNSNSPMVIKDSVVFETNSNVQDVKLIAVGQDVYLHVPDHFPINGLPPYSITGRQNTDTTLPNDKPHLFFGYTVIDTDCKLTMQAGTKCYFYNHAVLWVYEGTLIVKGEPGNEVVFQGYRQEAEYKDIPGQWGKIWLSKGSKENVIEWAIIKNGGIGIQADSLVPGFPTLKLSHTIIKNMTAAALYTQGAWTWTTNCLFYNCGQFAAALTRGGNYRFEHCTFANYWAGSEARTTPLLLMNNYYIAGSTAFVTSLDSCNFNNCILYGSLPEEIGIDSVEIAGAFTYHFDHCLIKTERALDVNHYSNCNANLDPGFIDPFTDYKLKSDAFNSIDKGALSIYTTSLNNAIRPIGLAPDLGAYENY
jgi:hypothetical protein